jgi:methyl-accepting chemotaxis protein
MVEASRLGLQSVRYYTHANSVAAAKLQEICDELLNSSGYLDPAQVKLAVKDLLEGATYIKQATKYQDDTNEKLAAAIRVTTQVTDQLTVGAKSAEEAAIQLEGVVDQLRTLVGVEMG